MANYLNNMFTSIAKGDLTKNNIFKSIIKFFKWNYNFKKKCINKMIGMRVIVENKNEDGVLQEYHEADFNLVLFSIYTVVTLAIGYLIAFLIHN